MLVGRDEMIFFHQLRNDLYHNGNGFVPSEAHMLGAREASLWVFDTLFEAGSEELLNQNFAISKADLKRENLSSATEFLQAFIGLKKSIDIVLHGKGLQATQPASSIQSAWDEVVKNTNENKDLNYSTALKEAESIRDAILGGEDPPQTPGHLREISASLEAASEHLDQHLRTYQSEIVHLAVEATAAAVPPTGNGNAGIFCQALGTGLGLTVAGYVARARNLPSLLGKRILVVVDSLALARQHYELLSRILSQERVRISAPLDAASLRSDLTEKEPSIVITNIQKLVYADFVIDEPVLVVGYNLKTTQSDLLRIFPASTRILFATTSPGNSHAALEVFGPIRYKYAFNQAVAEGVVTPVVVQQKNLGSAARTLLTCRGAEVPPDLVPRAF